MKRLMKIAYDYNLALEFFKHELCYEYDSNKLTSEFISETCIQDALTNAIISCATAEYHSGDEGCSYEDRTGEPSYWEVSWDIHDVINETIQRIDIPTLTNKCYSEMKYYDLDDDDPKYKDHVEEFKQILEDRSTFQKIVTDIVHSNALKRIIYLYAENEDSPLCYDAVDQIIERCEEKYEPDDCDNYYDPFDDEPDDDY